MPAPGGFGLAMTRRSFLAALGVSSLACAAPVRERGQSPRRGLVSPERLDHLALRVSDLERSVEFYSKLFGANIVRSDAPIIANLYSVPTPHAWLYLDWSFLALSLASPENGAPGIDHYCLAVGGMGDAELVRGLEARNLDRRVDEKWFPEIVWARDPSGHIVQFTTQAGGFTGLGRAALPGSAAAAVAARGAFEATGVTRVRLVATDPDPTLDYYRELLGKPVSGRDRRAGRLAAFDAGRSRLELAGPEQAQSFRVGVAGFDPDATARVLAGLGVVAQGSADGSALACSDPDGIRLEIGAGPA